MMQDIRPMPKKPLDYARGKPGGMPVPPSDELYEITQPPRRPANKQSLPGASVPVTNVHVENKPLDDARGKPPRPLFATTSVPAAAAQRIRLGKRERVTVLALLATVAVVALLSVAIFLPAAHVKLVLATAPLLVDQELTVRASETELPSVVPGAGFFREVAVEGAVPVVSTEMIGTKASGTVDVVNQTSEEQKIRDRSRLVTKDNVLFYMTRSATVPPEGRVSVPVEAAEAGEIGNIEPQRLDFAALSLQL